MTAEGSALIKVGNTHVLCAATVEDTVPPFLRNSGKGWVTAEYSMLPRATAKRTPREVTKGRPSGRTHEIQRLIGRSMRAAVDMTALGERTVIIDCDVIQADGGTRTASVTGAFVAMAMAFRQLRKYGVLKSNPLREYVAATSVGLVGGVPMLDLCYEEDSQADVDMNVVMTGAGQFVEVQATAEHDAVRRRADGANDGAGAHRHRGTGAEAAGDHRRLTRLYCATGNAGKLREFRMAADSARVEIELLPAYRQLPAAVEDGATFEENAIKKALHYGPHADGLLFADDSGLEVEALGGAPGVYSARFSGPHATDDSQQPPAAGETARRGQPEGALRMRDRAGGGRARGGRLSRRGGRRDSGRGARRPAASATTRCFTVRLLAARSARRRGSRNSR